MNPFSAPSQPTRPESRWSRWLDDQGNRFFLYARQQTRSESDAKDVLQDALTESWRKSGGAIPDSGLVLATIRRRAMDLGRSLDRRSRREHKYADERPTLFVSDPSLGDTGEHLIGALEQLPGHLREVLILRIWENQSFPAIGQLTGVPTTTASSRYRYALDRLREALTELQP